MGRFMSKGSVHELFASCAHACFAIRSVLRFESYVVIVFLCCRSGNTALHAAVMGGQKDSVEWLLTANTMLKAHKMNLDAKTKAKGECEEGPTYGMRMLRVYVCVFQFMDRNMSYEFLLFCPCVMDPPPPPHSFFMHNRRIDAVPSRYSITTMGDWSSVAGQRVR